MLCNTQSGTSFRVTLVRHEKATIETLVVGRKTLSSLLGLLH